MNQSYEGVTARFLRDDERLLLSAEKEMPLVIEANERKDTTFLQQFLAANSDKLMTDLAQYGAILLRGFAVRSDQDFENTILSLPQLHGINEAFMAENGRTHVGNLKYVLHTNSVYKTGGTLYLGGFHTENYYSPDVPAYICFYCAQPPAIGGETGLISTQKIYKQLAKTTQQRLEQKPFFVAKWLVSEVIERYQITIDELEALCRYFNLPLVGEGKERFILMYKPSVFLHPQTQEKSLQLNLFEIVALNKQLRRCFMADYAGNTWFWHRFFWRLPSWLFNSIEFLAVMCIAFMHSPRNSLKIMRHKIESYLTNKKVHAFSTERVGDSFTQEEVEHLAQSMRDNYSSCLWQQGDIIIVDNRQVMHAGMPGKGERTIRAMICNPVAMAYSVQQEGLLRLQSVN